MCCTCCMTSSFSEPSTFFYMSYDLWPSLLLCLMWLMCDQVMLPLTLTLSSKNRKMRKKIKRNQVYFLQSWQYGSRDTSSSHAEPKTLNVSNVIGLIKLSIIITLYVAAKQISKLISYVLRQYKVNYTCIFSNVWIAKVTTRLIQIHAHSESINSTKNGTPRSTKNYMILRTNQFA